MSKYNYKFKVGDKVRVVESEAVQGRLDAGTVHTVVKVNGLNCVLLDSGRNDRDWWCVLRFELVKEESNVKEFDLHKDKWFIRTPTPEISEAVQLWLFEQGIYWIGNNNYKNEVRATDSKILTNLEYRSTTKFVKGKFMHDSGPIEMEYYPPELEIKIKFKVDSVEYPVVIETASQKELRILKEQIAQLTQQANKLETTLKGEV